MTRLPVPQPLVLDRPADRLRSPVPPPADDAEQAWVHVALHAQPPVVTVIGAIDVAVERQLRGLFDWLQGLRLARLVVDVSGVTFIDSTGAQPLLDAQRSAGGWGGAVELRGSCPALELLLSALGSPLPAVDAAGRTARARSAPRQGESVGEG